MWSISFILRLEKSVRLYSRNELSNRINIQDDLILVTRQFRESCLKAYTTMQWGILGNAVYDFLIEIHALGSIVLIKGNSANTH